MLVVAHPFLRRLAKPLAFALALLSLVFLLQVTTHSHANGHDEPACRLCQVAHLGAAQAVSAVVLSIPLVSFGQVAVNFTPEVSEFFSEDSPSRAPPSLVAL